MSNFVNNSHQPFTVFMNDFIQGETIFEKAHTKLIYMYLYSLRNVKVMFPSHETISKATCTSLSTVKRTLKELEELGLLKIKPRPGFTSIYILEDYYEVVEKRVAQRGLGSEDDSEVALSDLGHADTPTLFSQTYPPRSHRTTKKTSTKNKTIKNKNSSSSSTLSQRSIEARNKADNEFREKYPNLPFDQIRDDMLNDDTLVLTTINQYKSMLNYRLKNYKPKKAKTQKKVERVPDWFNGRNSAIDEKPDKTIDFEAERAKILKKLSNNQN